MGTEFTRKDLQCDDCTYHQFRHCGYDLVPGRSQCRDCFYLSENIHGYDRGMEKCVAKKFFFLLCTDSTFCIWWKNRRCQADGATNPQPVLPKYRYGGDHGPGGG